MSGTQNIKFERAMDKLEFDFFFKQLKAGKNIDETCFYFNDDERQQEHYLGFLPQYNKPYWVGYCDIPEGAEFHTAEELMDSPIFSHQSLSKRWDNVRIVSIEGVCLEDWLDCFHHV